MSPLSLMDQCYSWMEKAPACFMESNGVTKLLRLS